MKCEICKYKQDIANSKEAGVAVCIRNASHFPVNYEDECHFLPSKRELLCRDCARYGEDYACIEAEADDNACIDGKLCEGFIDAKEQEFQKILMWWKAQGMYDRDKIEEMIDKVEEFYNDIKCQ